MIDRNALWISVLLVFAMVAASLWRLSLLPDWHHVPLDGPGSSRTIPVLRMLIDPLAVLFVMGMLFARKWLSAAAFVEETLNLSRRNMVTPAPLPQCAVTNPFTPGRTIELPAAPIVSPAEMPSCTL